MSENYSFLLQIRSYDNNVFSIWIELLQSIEEKASNYYSLLQGLEKEILKDVKKLKTCKQQRIKKFNDRVSGIQKDVETSVTEVRFFSPQILLKSGSKVKYSCKELLHNKFKIVNNHSLNLLIFLVGPDQTHIF